MPSPRETGHQAQIDRRTLISGAAALALAATGPSGSVAAQSVEQLAPGMTPVTSLRLPVDGISRAQLAQLLAGSVANWQEVGSPVSLPVTIYGVDGIDIEGAAELETVPDYATLSGKLAEDHGGLAVVPVDQVDLTTKALLLDGDDPFLEADVPGGPYTKVGFGGDILFGRNVGDRMRRYGDFTFPMLQLKELLGTFDLTICNWECFVSEKMKPPELLDPHTLDFVTVPAAIDGVMMAGVDAVSMANNHAFYSDSAFGDDAYFDTARFLDEKGLPHFGAGKNLEEARRPFSTELNGTRIAIFGVDGVTANVDFPDPRWIERGGTTIATETKAGTNPLVLANVVEDISTLLESHDVVIPFFHMGEQYRWLPAQFAVDVARACIDAGAAAVVTSHPHTIQGMEIYRGKPIFHAIGNLVYDQMFSVDTRTGYIVEMTLRGKDVVNFRIHGFENFDFCQARLMPPGEHAALMNRFWRSTDMIARFR